MTGYFAEIGYPRAKHYMNPDPRVDFALYDNEDIGLDAAIASDDAYEFALPYPADVDLDEEALQIHWIDFIFQDSPLHDLDADIALEAVDLLFSMLDFDFNTSNPANTADDTNALELKKAFDGPYTWEWNKKLLSHASGTPASESVVPPQGAGMGQGIQFLRWIPLHILDLPLPLFIAFVNRSKDQTETNMDTAFVETATTLQERVMMRIWYTSRKLTANEKSLRGQAKFMRLGA